MGTPTARNVAPAFSEYAETVRGNHCSKIGRDFLHRIVTRGRKLDPHASPKSRKSWGNPDHASTSTAKTNIHGKKQMLFIWWDILEGIYYELLPPNETIPGERYQQQLMQLSQALKHKQPQYAERHDKVGDLSALQYSAT
ncbi:mariner Mos1 transposase [Trichonephila clavipes]|nr:mariner Mos1 transposase [Trichonephila clavipes]